MTDEEIKSPIRMENGGIAIPYKDSYFEIPEEIIKKIVSYTYMESLIKQPKFYNNLWFWGFWGLFWGMALQPLIKWITGL